MADRDDPRDRCADDGRGLIARITPAGRKALKAANRQHIADVRELFLDHVSENEMRVLGRVWQRLMEASGEARPPDEPVSGSPSRSSSG